jgi:photosystem II stability/assembly factor-like uncharacterized protein
MARTQYGAMITELNGSIGGFTFQQNASGKISRTRVSRISSNTLKQGYPKRSFIYVASLWNGLSSVQKGLWNTFAAANPFTDYWGRIKALTGYNWFMALNINLWLMEITEITTPPTLGSPVVVPDFCLDVSDLALTVDFGTEYDPSDIELFIFASPPMRSASEKNRKDLRLINIHPSFPVTVIDITTAWQSYYAFSWPPSSYSGSFSILVAIAAVNYTTGQASVFTTQLSQFYLTGSVGLSWSNLGQQFSQDSIFSLYGFCSGVCLAGTGPNGKILRSTDFGDTWSDLGQQFSQTQIRSLYGFPSGVCLAGTYPDGKILRSTDFGATWSDLGQQFGQTSIFSLYVFSSGICLAGTDPDGKILRSTDFGATWSDLGQQFSQVHIRSLYGFSSGVCIAGTYPDGKILRSTDFGATWSDLGQQFGQTSILSLCGFSSGICLAGTSPNGKILRSTDYGATWSDLGQQFSQASITSLYGFSSGVCLAGTYTDGKILRSTDFGATWSDLGQQFSQDIIYSLGSISSGICLAGTNPDGLILRSVPV